MLDIAIKIWYILVYTHKKVNTEMKDIKFPKIYHLPYSEGVNRDDRVLKSTDHFVGKNVVVTLKMDGENTCMVGGKDKCHARSLDSGNHPSRTWVKNLYSKIRLDIPDDWRIFGENLYAKHSIHYKNLRSYFYTFSIWTQSNTCLSWDETMEWSEILGLETVDIIYKGKWGKDLINNIYNHFYYPDEKEGFVVRLADAFHYSMFSVSIAKYVRAGHVQTDEHWMHQAIIKNELKG